MFVFAVICGAVVGIGTMVFLFKPFFGCSGGFLECLRYYFTPDVISLFRGQWGEDWWAETKLFVWVACGGVMGLAVYTAVMKLAG
jgi:hypothetical protein